MQQLHALDQPGQFFVRDDVLGGIPGLDIGALQAGEGSLGEPGIARPDGLQSDVQTLGL